MSRLGWRVRRLAAGPLLVLGASLLVTGAGVWAPQPAEAATVSSANAQDAVAFWTAERMMRAKPLDLRLPRPSRIDPPVTASDDTGGPHVYPPRRPMPAASTSSPFEPVPDPTTPAARQNGVIFMVTPFGLGRCSGTSVNAPNFSVVMTAGHCIRTGGPGGSWIGFRWVFVPGYRYGQRPFGVFPAKWIDTTLRWRSTGSENYDVGAAVVTRNGRGERLAEAVGGAGIAWNLKARQVFDIHGYPAEAPYDGETQHVCAGTPFLGHDARSFLSPGPLNLAAACKVTGGASGGGWTIESNILNSVTNYGYYDDPDTDFGAYFGREVGRLFTRAGRIK
jgi:hypothetical protein